MERRAPDEARLAAADWASKGVPSSIMMSKPFAPAQLLTAVSHVLHTDAPTINELMETTMTDAAFDAQGPGTADRNPRINAGEGATWRMTVHDSGSWRARRSRARRPRGSMGPVSVSGMAAHWHPSTRG